MMWVLWWILILFGAGTVLYFVWLHEKGNKYRLMWDKAESLAYDHYRDSVWLKVGMIPKLLWFWFDDSKWMNVAEGLNRRITFIHKRKRIWGGFEVFSETWRSFWLLDYDCTENNWLTRRIVDHIRILPDGTIIGKFHIRIFGRLWFLAWFTMEVL